MAGIEIRDDNGNVISPDAVIEGLTASVAMTLIMEARRFKSEVQQGSIDGMAE